LVGCVHILLPASSLTGLTPSQLKLFLAHEFSPRHPLRLPLFNAFQIAVETLMFYTGGLPGFQIA